MVDLFFIPQVLYGKMPELLQFLRSTIPASPPEPASVQFMKEPQHYRDSLPMRAFQVLQEHCYFIQPATVDSMLFPSGQDGSHRTGRRLPGRSPGQRIIQVPADRDHTAARITIPDELL